MGKTTDLQKADSKLALRWTAFFGQPWSLYAPRPALPACPLEHGACVEPRHHPVHRHHRHVALLAAAEHGTERQQHVDGPGEETRRQAAGSLGSATWQGSPSAAWQGSPSTAGLALAAVAQTRADLLTPHPQATGAGPHANVQHHQCSVMIPSLMVAGAPAVEASSQQHAGAHQIWEGRRQRGRPKPHRPARILLGGPATSRPPQGWAAAQQHPAPPLMQRERVPPSSSLWATPSRPAAALLCTDRSVALRRHWHCWQARGRTWL